MSAPFQAASGPFADVLPAGTVQVVSAARRMAVFHGLDALAAGIPASGPAVAAAGVRPAPGAGGAEEAVAARRSYAAPITAPIRVRVTAGETLFALALRYNTTVDAIVAANNLPSAHVLRIGQELILPVGAAATARAPARPASRPAARRAASSTTYEVESGDTLFAIARRYGTTVDAIVAANGLPSAHRLRIGQRLVVPGRGGNAAVPPPPVARLGARPVLAPRATLNWPARGRISSRYGWRYRRHHDGIDIASPRGTPIAAARAGRVVFAGWYYGYGRAVIIDHDDGIRTLYGHASKLLVRTGQTVERGQVVALVGCTGRCTGSHLHFEVRVNGRAVNPLPYLR